MTVSVGNVIFDNAMPFSLIAGPCQMESETHAMDMCGMIKEVCDSLNIGLVYKSSFDKANRTSLDTVRGLGIEQTLQVFEKVKNHYGVPVLTDVHEKEHCGEVSSVIDILQIPAFLCR